MKIVLVGGGTGGHFYPLIAVAEAMQDLAAERKLLEPELYYLGPAPFDERALLEHDIKYVPSPAGKLHRDRSVGNALGMFSTFFGIVRALFQLFRLYPDIVFSSGGYAAFPTLYAAKLLNIPVAIYDADATPGRVSLWSSKFARWIALAHPAAAAKFPENIRHRIAQTGHPIRKEIESPAKEGGYEFLKLDPNAPTVFIMGGSQGAVSINEVVLDALPDLVALYNVIHQAGTANLEEVARVASVILKDSRHKERYAPYGLLNTLALRMAAGIATVIVARAGSGTIFEVASWGIPSIMVPIPMDISHDQTENAFSYARAGGCTVIEQKNLTPHLLAAEIKRIVDDSRLREQMSQAAHAFARPQAARKIAMVLLDSALEHESA
ncbi:MAG TPA: UDP-N-acetylglucosamine--N-acetylmuramyl-(pentapeptide) pyrophosphoryl-undecaprenol N-acetylglucosamine transferase [Candidatus Paceibacterota bacterium]|nr:UDP-N-acetylglucosamine--N-acetylmuramyl-(pentapeptide) pyrophosphoryl-undecaprenol N-acetylglucosamine transferase [Candidatus Paceibacterota bacterium]